MDSDSQPGKSPRRELQLQGPRPAPLKVRKDSHKIRKPPVAPPQQHLPTQQPQAPPRPPVIIYAVSPKVIHTDPSEFMALVQRLTGASSTYMPSPLASSSGGAISPAARFASIEKAKPPEGKKQRIGGDHTGALDVIESMDHGVVERSGSIPGILSPGPGSLQPIPATFFSPPSDPNPLSFFHDLSPALYSAKYNSNFNAESSFLLPSPSTTFISPRITSPAPSSEFFSNFFDL